MEQLKLGGFPPLVKKTKNINIDKKQKELKPQFFATSERKNINIREILLNKSNLFEEKKEELLEEVNTI